MSEKIDLLAQAICEAQKEMPSVKKDSENPFFKSRYAELSTVIETCKPILNKHGLSIVQLPDTMGEHSSVCTVLMHKSGQFIAGDLLLNAKANDPQAQGSAITYARRYSYMGAAGVAAEDDDAESAMNRQKQPLRAVAKVSTPKVTQATSHGPEVCDCGNQMMISKLDANEFYCNPRTGGCGAKRQRS